MSELGNQRSRHDDEESLGAVPACVDVDELGVA
jgi:hypothetical protein